MRFMGHHGIDAEEQAHPQPFVVDLEVEGDFREAGARDDPALTVDTQDLYAVIKRTVEANRFRLLEALAEAIATHVLQVSRIAAVTLRVKKLEAKLGGSLEYEGVQITRRR